MTYKIINTGSDGNATIVEDTILIDCGVSFKKIKPYIQKLQLVLLTHIHQDHFNKTTIRKLAEDRPTLRFGCCEWLVQELIDCGVDKGNIDVYILDKKAIYNDNLRVKPVKLYHDVPQCGYKVEINNYKVFYATDTKTLEGIKAIGYDYYFVEANYVNDEELHDRAYNDYYENRVKNTHLSQEQATNWLLENMSFYSNYQFMHQHKEKNRIGEK